MTGLRWSLTYDPWRTPIYDAFDVGTGEFLLMVVELRPREWSVFKPQFREQISGPHRRRKEAFRAATQWAEQR